MAATSYHREVRVPVRSDLDVLKARQDGREMARELAFISADSTLVATAISELARNIIQYAGQGEIIITAAEEGARRGIIIVAHDDGPGIPNISEAMQDGYSTSGGLGLGLPGVRRLMDEFEIFSEVNAGTTVRVKKWLR
ncbi:MAG: ATP-binding protein [Acidobacteria bacterium]|nr:ATP-binding protein [Acidobacteriota bacterium]